MKLMTQKIKKQLANYPLKSQDGKKGETVVVCKFFLPVGSWTWYVFEAEEQEDGDWEFFGLVVGAETEMGYFKLSDLEEINVRPYQLGIERDMYFDPCLLKDLDRTDHLGLEEMGLI